MRTYEINTAATTYPVSLTEAKEHLKVDTTADDTLITNLIVAASQLSEEYTNRFFITTTITQYCTKFEELKSLFKSPVSDVTHIKYYGEDNVQATLSTGIYIENLQWQPSQINLKDGKDWPKIFDRVDAVECKYTVGYGAASDVPQAIKQAILLTIGNWYANRESVITGRTTSEMPMSAKWLLDTYKVLVV